jgi:protein O-GlcNAc transferase
MARAVELVADGDCAAAAPQLRRMLDEQLADPAQLHHYLGVCLQGAGDLAGAEAEYRQALLLNPALFESLNNLGVVLGELGRHDESLAVLDMLVQAFPAEAAAHYNLGFEQAQAGDLEAALASFRKAAELDDCGTDALLQASELLRVLGREDERIAALQAAAGRVPGDGVVAVALARVLRAAGRNDEAVLALQDATGSAANNGQVLAALAFELRDLGRVDEALAVATTALERSVGDAEGSRIAALACAVIARGAGREAEAEAALRTGVERLPGEPGLAFFLGGLLAEQGRCDEATPVLKRALDAYAATAPEGPQATELRRALAACGATSVTP